MNLPPEPIVVAAKICNEVAYSDPASPAVYPAQLLSGSADLSVESPG